MKTHRERAQAAVILLRETRGEHDEREVITQETYPAELVEAADRAQRVLCYHGCGGGNHRPACTNLRDALDAYDDRHDSCTRAQEGG